MEAIFPLILQDYFVFHNVTGEAKVQSDNRFLDSIERKKVAQRASALKVDARILTTIEQLSSKLPENVEREKSLLKLSSGNCCAVVTGQQIGLFCSPLFSVYKALGAIRYAEFLEQETGVNHVPIFWLQTEDHDFEEVSTCHLLCKDYDIRSYSIDTNLQKRTPLVHHLVPQSIESIHASLEDELGFYDTGKILLKNVAAAYEVNRPLYLAFAQLMASILGERGILFFNPNTELVYHAAANVLQTAYTKSQIITEHLQTFADELSNEGLSTQVHIRENSPLFFYQPAGASERYRIWLDGQNAKLIGADEAAIPVSKIESDLISHPERFSCSALLRPIMQDSIFPTSVYLGGRAEGKYMQQIAALYKEFGLEQPIFAPRPSFNLLDAKSYDWLISLQLNSSDFGNQQELLRRFVSAQTPSELLPEKIKTDFESALFASLEPVRKAIAKVDQTLENTADKSHSKMIQAFDILINKYSKALENSNDIARVRLEKLQSLLAPLDQPQERTLSILSFLARYGDALIERIEDSIVPFEDYQTRDIVL